MVDRNDSMTTTQGTTCYEQLKDVDDMNDFGSWALDTKCYKQLKVVDDMNYLGSRDPKPLDIINNWGLLMTWMTPGYEHKAQDAMSR